MVATQWEGGIIRYLPFKRDFLRLRQLEAGVHGVGRMGVGFGDCEGISAVGLKLL